MIWRRRTMIDHLARRFLGGRFARFGPKTARFATIMATYGSHPSENGHTDANKNDMHSEKILKNFSGRLGKLSANDLCALTKSMLYNRCKLSHKDFDGIVDNLRAIHEDSGGMHEDMDLQGKANDDSQNLMKQNKKSVALDALGYLLLLGVDITESSFSKCLPILDGNRTTTDPNHQLKLLDIAYTIACFYPELQKLYTPQLSNYFEYLKLVAPEIRLQCLHHPESQEVLDIKNVLEHLKINFSSAITGLFVYEFNDQQVICTLQWYWRRVV
ncbi:hypothetical protein BEWA_029750 [Theileria equi strain WA]|uniref:Uncharacterized protein n=1 Tax=Theileria equi strain WA TaxID=1537102 RepID=L0AZ00_THEEQ|nr:hypothetical protein BEWA_029750 [Theileria equi strain WA]AFZ80124.1 hypothetical protein BEWA_029750 [Theileria equi strain WA]|eukprot:XP_004829790.1 hypothetical protein BEWA_029750 [Theileria equi strain WA]